MPSFKNMVLAVAAALVATVQADYYIDPDSVSPGVRKSWCDSELSTCPLICQLSPKGTVSVNTCDSDTLTYGCICGDGKAPNISEYSLTLPYFVCSEWGNQCVKKCGIKANNCASDCRQNNPCGALTPKLENKTVSMTSSMTSATASATGQVFDGPSGNLASGLEIGRSLGLVMVLGSLAAGFAIML